MKILIRQHARETGLLRRELEKETPRRFNAERALKSGKIHYDGRSFDVEHVLNAKRCKRPGLLSMRERVEMFGGTPETESESGKGTLVRTVVPTDRVRPEKPGKAGKPARPDIPKKPRTRK